MLYFDGLLFSGGLEVEGSATEDLSSFVKQFQTVKLVYFAAVTRLIPLSFFTGTSEVQCARALSATAFDTVILEFCLSGFSCGLFWTRPLMNHV